MNFWDEYAELRRDCPDATWEFMENEERVHGLSPYDFLHGFCNVFSVYLNKTYGYPITFVYEDDTFAQLVHAFCTVPETGELVDIRGRHEGFADVMADFKDYYTEGVGAVLSGMTCKDNLREVTAVDEGSLAYSAAKKMAETYRFYAAA